MGGISLVHGWVPWTVYVLAPVAVVLSVSWRGGRWRHELAWGLSVGVAVAVLAYGLVEVLDVVPWSFPTSFYAYAALVVVAVVVAVVDLRATRVWRALDSVLAVVLSSLLLGVVVNGHYQYFPTVANLFGEVAANEVSLADLDGIRAEVRSSGRLPDEGYTVHVSIPGTASGFDAREAYVWLPPAFFADPAPALPVLLMIHGTPGAPEDWLVGGRAGQVADDFAADHQGLAPILVAPDASGDDFTDTECVDSSRGQVETYLTTDVPDFVDDTFGTRPGSASWGVAGLSMGGYCALALSLRHPDRFGAFGDYSGLAQPALDPPDDALGDLFGGDQQAMDAHDPTRILATARFPQLAGWFEVGADDSDPRAAIEAVSAQASEAGIATCVLVRPGGHDFGLWHQAFEDSLPWLSQHLGLVTGPVDTHGATCDPP
jgi:enterochelin esterase-like enzyme